MKESKVSTLTACCFVTMMFAACGDGPAEAGNDSTLTVDSNTVAQGDSIPAILHLDNADDTTFPIALDSLGPTVDAEDTSRKRQ